MAGSWISPRLWGTRGVSSTDFVAFMKVVVDEFGVEITAGDCQNFQSLAELIAFLDNSAA